MNIQGKFCPNCNNDSSIVKPEIIEHAMKGNKMSCTLCKCEFWVFTPSDVLFLEAWGINPEVTYDYAQVAT